MPGKVRADGRAKCLEVQHCSGYWMEHFLAVASRAALGSTARHLVLFVESLGTHRMLFIDTRD